MRDRREPLLKYLCLIAVARVIVRNHARTWILKPHDSLARLYELNGGQLVVLTISNSGK